MVESAKKTFTAHLLDVLTPERFVWMAIVLIGATITTGLRLDKASDLIMSNTTQNAAQKVQLDGMDNIQRQYALDINTLKINMEQIKEMIGRLDR